MTKQKQPDYIARHVKLRIAEALRKNSRKSYGFIRTCSCELPHDIYDGLYELLSEEPQAQCVTLSVGSWSQWQHPAQSQPCIYW